LQAFAVINHVSLPGAKSKVGYILKYKIDTPKIESIEIESIEIESIEN
jgi:hypothetical protein